jgi:hypothetical protein
MSRQNLVRFNVGGVDPLTLFAVKVSTSFVIPDSKQVASPVHSSFGGGLLASVIPTVGGQLLAATNDGAAGTASIFDLTGEDVCDLRPGDTIALSAVVSTVVTLTITSVDGTVRTYLITGVTTTAVVTGYYA